MKPYTPLRLITALHEHFDVWTAAGLARVMYVERQQLNDIKRGVVPVNYKYLLRIHETSGLSVAYLRDLLGDKSDEPYEPPSGKRSCYYWE
jgi:hypothetical protein